ncbi:D-alanine--D-alanine ligase [Patulibacter medicamentivorans]|uniref:D-alanine--D-alanine ligase n=1 Tax=Patulibacter medicamentivorans TaxID=1097667 RepID=H0E9K4_9ACTN|nr:D-alanine--D-alanine ligase [Patulibacter medicamentivorans]EHN09646.1 D-alanine--D-alanine ligase [Patulibacter medicamentivorans]
MRVAVLMGGRSLERQVSLQSGQRVDEALRRLGHEVHAVDVDHSLVRTLDDLRPDVAFVALHGEDGEDGTVQELLEVLEIPYTGSAPAACERCWDKVVAKRALAAAGIATPDSVSVSSSAFKQLGAADALARVGERLGFPLVIKPSRQGSALGLKIVQRPEEVPGALVAALSYDDRALLERYVDGHDLSVSILAGEALPIVEVHPRDHDPYSARYTIGQTTFTCPADLDPAVASATEALALRAFEALGARGFARVDLLADRTTNELTVLEVDAVPGLTHTSYLPVAAEAAGIGLDQLVERLLELALADTARA